ncbi:MAG: cytochrome b [Legionella sp.]|nr:MAG: cytochrome b [Legionella sp.]
MDAAPLRNYSPLLRAFHWLIALTVIIMLIVGFLLDDVPDQYKAIAYMIHKSIGLTILWLMILRFIAVHAIGKPPLPVTVKTWERILSRVVQYGFYVLLILMPLSGWIMSVAADRVPTYFGFFKVPIPGLGPDKSLAELMANAHYIIACVLIGMIVLHVSGALKHHFIDKDRVLKSMWSGKD